MGRGPVLNGYAIISVDVLFLSIVGLYIVWASWLQKTTVTVVVLNDIELFICRHSTIVHNELRRIEGNDHELQT